MTAAAWKDTRDELRAVLFSSSPTEAEAEIGLAALDVLEFLGDLYDRSGVGNVLRESAEHVQWAERAVRTLATLDLIARRADGGPATPNISANIAAAEATIRARVVAAIDNTSVPEAERFLLRRAIETVAVPVEPRFYVESHYEGASFLRRNSAFPEREIGGQNNGELALELTAAVAVADEWLALVADAP